MRENFPNLVEETDIKSRSTESLTPRPIIIKMQKIKRKRENLKSSKREAVIQGNSHKTVS